MSANYDLEYTHQVTDARGESGLVQLQTSGEAICSSHLEFDHVPVLECRQGIWYENGKPFEGKVEQLQRRDPEIVERLELWPAPSPPRLLNADQIKALHSQGLKPESIPAPLIAAFVLDDTGNKLLQELSDHAPMIWEAGHSGRPTDRLVFVTTPLEALAHAQEHSDEKARTYVAIGDRLTPATAAALEKHAVHWGHDADRATLAFPNSAKGESLAQTVGSVLEKASCRIYDKERHKFVDGTFNVAREKPSLGKTWGDQVCEHNKELVQSAPGKYRSLDRDR
jgi:hypothetical protein